MVDEMFYARGIAALLHDPPWKVWLVTQTIYYDLERLVDALSEGLDIDRERLTEGTKGKGHEAQGFLVLRALKEYSLKMHRETGKNAYKSMAELFEEAEKIWNSPGVRICDWFASYLDRTMTWYVERTLSEMERRKGVEKQVSIKAGLEVFVNPFNPDWTLKAVGPPAEDKIKEYIVSLVKSTINLAYNLIDNRSGNGRLKPGSAVLHALLLALEEEWYRVVGSLTIPLADSRTPHHTIFDHLYATLSACSMISEDGTPTGRILVVDLASVQSWIWESRRLRDLWASSWIASYLAWKTVEGLVEEYGPATMISPPTRLNPFYISWLASKAGKTNGCTEDSPLCRAYNIAMPIGWPVDPILPSRLILVIPRADDNAKKAGEDIRERIISAYRSAWKPILDGTINILKDYYNNIKKDEGKREREDDRDVALEYAYKIKEKLKELKKELENVEPPLPLRLIIIDLKDVVGTSNYKDFQETLLQEFKKRLKGSPLVKDRIPPEILLEILEGKMEAEKRIGWRKELVGLYPYIMLIAIPQEDMKAKIKLSRRSGPSIYRVYKSLHSIYKSLKTGDWKPTCTVCGRLPAIVIGDVKPKPDSRSKQEFEKFENDQVYLSLVREVREGERLCIYCLSKRLLRSMILHTRLDEKLVGIKAGMNVHRVLKSGSTDHYTAVTQTMIEYMYDKLINIIRSKGKPEDLVNIYLCGIKGWLPSINPLIIVKNNIVYMKRGELSEAIRELLKKDIELSKGLDDDTIELIADTVESVFLEALHDEAYRKMLVTRDSKIGECSSEKIPLLKEIGEATGDRRLRRYSRQYAIVVADGDFMGSGILQGRLGMDPRVYYEKLLNAARVENEYKGLVRDVTSSYVRALEETLNKILPPKSDAPRLTVAVSPSYHYTVSRALAATSIIDRDTVDDLGGFLIYAGGDDLLAIAPPLRDIRGETFCSKTRFELKRSHWRHSIDSITVGAAALELLYESRRNYWGLGEQSRSAGFNELKYRGIGDACDTVSLVSPSLGVYGRSTVVYLTHIKTPMWLSMARAHEILDTVKDSYSLCSPGSEEIKKDVGVLYNERGTWAVIPLSGKIGLETGFLAQLISKIFLKRVLEDRGCRLSAGSLYRVTDPQEAKVINRLVEIGEHDYALSYLDLLAETSNCAREGEKKPYKNLRYLVGEDNIGRIKDNLIPLKVRLDVGSLPSYMANRGLPIGITPLLEVFEGVKALRGGIRG